MGPKVTWNNSLLKRVYYFNDLNVGEGFKLQSGDAIYMKVSLNRGLRTNDYGQLEVATGIVFPARGDAAVERVDVSMAVSAIKPRLY